MTEILGTDTSQSVEMAENKQNNEKQVQDKKLRAAPEKRG